MANRNEGNISCQTSLELTRRANGVTTIAKEGAANGVGSGVKAIANASEVGSFIGQVIQISGFYFLRANRNGHVAQGNLGFLRIGRRRPAIVAAARPSSIEKALPVRRRDVCFIYGHRKPVRRGRGVLANAKN